TYRRKLTWLIRTRRRPKSNIEPVPRVDSCNDERQVKQLFITEFLPRHFVNLIRNLAPFQFRNGFGPCERRLFARRVKIGLAPGRNEIDPLLGLVLVTLVL